MPLPTEREESLKIASWARMMVETNQEPRLRLLRCGFEGLRLSMGLRMQVKRQSISKGWPDWALFVPQRYPVPYHGLLIELKREKGGVLSFDQTIMHKLLEEQGYIVAVAYGGDHAIDIIIKYLGI